MVQSFPANGRMRYGPVSPRERPHERGGASGGLSGCGHVFGLCARRVAAAGPDGVRGSAGPLPDQENELEAPTMFQASGQSLSLTSDRCHPRFRQPATVAD